MAVHHRVLSLTSDFLTVFKPVGAPTLQMRGASEKVHIQSTEEFLRELPQNSAADLFPGPKWPIGHPQGICHRLDNGTSGQVESVS